MYRVIIYNIKMDMLIKKISLFQWEMCSITMSTQEALQCLLNTYWGDKLWSQSVSTKRLFKLKFRDQRAYWDSGLQDFWDTHPSVK